MTKRSDCFSQIHLLISSYNACISKSHYRRYLITRQCLLYAYGYPNLVEARCPGCIHTAIWAVYIKTRISG